MLLVLKMYEKCLNLTTSSLSYKLYLENVKNKVPAISYFCINENCGHIADKNPNAIDNNDHNF